MADRELERVTGRVERELVRRGTAGEHMAVVLRIAGGDRLVLQRIGGNPFDDPATQKLAGREVTVEGFRLGDIFRFLRVEGKGEGEGEAKD